MKKIFKWLRDSVFNVKPLIVLYSVNPRLINVVTDIYITDSCNQFFKVITNVAQITISIHMNESHQEKSVALEALRVLFYNTDPDFDSNIYITDDLVQSDEGVITIQIQ